MEFQSPFGFQADVCGTVKYCHIIWYNPAPLNVSAFTSNHMVVKVEKKDPHCTSTFNIWDQVMDEVMNQRMRSSV
jgi:hypothetical protein